MNSKEYVMPDGRKAVFEYDHDGIGKVTIEAMDMLMGLITDGRKRGEWVEDICKYDRAYHFKCSVCGEWNGLSVDEWNWKPNFCPHCGADMREREGE